ncbi:MAG: class I SAM-dependent methyltransferase, partial [Pontixanthobacter sp.]
MTASHEHAWDDFWASNAQHNGSGGCLPGSWQSIEKAQHSAWREFAKEIAEGAHVFDLATGDARVLQWLQHARADLELTGIDRAPTLPKAPEGITVKSGISMESLPFADGSFAIIVSQFGFEYSEIEPTAAEMARVLQKNGTIGLMTHRPDSPILAHNLQRRDHIEWALQEHDLISVAKRSLAARASGTISTNYKVAQAPEAAARKFGNRSAAWEISEAIRRTLIGGQNYSEAHVETTLNMIAEQAQNELDRIASLEGACRRMADQAIIDQAFLKAGLVQRSQHAVNDTANHKPFA